MHALDYFAKKIAICRKHQGLSQSELARLAGVSRATLDALENGRSSDIGFSKLTRLLAALKLELDIRPKSKRPTLDELQQGVLDD